MDEKEFKRYVKLGSPFLSTVLKEGVLLFMEVKNSEEFVKASLKRAEKALKAAKIL